MWIFFLEPLTSRLIFFQCFHRDVGKVTNWFRNLRQTVRKRAKKSGSDDDDEDDSFHPGGYSTFASRSGTPSVESSSSSMEMDVDNDHHHPHSDIGSEDEFQEAVTPSPECSLLPPSSVTNIRSGLSPSENFHHLLCHTEIDKAWGEQYSGIKVEDALLLLSFHRHIVHWKIQKYLCEWKYLLSISHIYLVYFRHEIRLLFSALFFTPFTKYFFTCSIQHFIASN